MFPFFPQEKGKHINNLTSTHFRGQSREIVLCLLVFFSLEKGQFMNFAQGHSGTKVRDVNRACFPKEKHQNSQKWAKFMNFSFWPFLWFGLPGRLLNGAGRPEITAF